MQRETESCMFEVWSLGGLKLFLHGFSVKADMIYSSRAGLVSWMSKFNQMIWKEKNVPIITRLCSTKNPRQKNKPHINLPVRRVQLCVVFFKDKSLLIK